MKLESYVLMKNLVDLLNFVYRTFVCLFFPCDNIWLKITFG